MPHSEINLKFMLLAGTILVLLLVTFVMVFLYMYQRRHMIYIVEKKSMESAYANELVQARLDQHEETMKRLGDDLHDQMSQMLGTVMMDLALLEVRIADNDSPKAVIEQTKNDLYNLNQVVKVISKSMSASTLEDFGLLEALEQQVMLSKKPDRIPLKVKIEGTIKTLSPQVEMVLYRMIQESIGNTLKYAHATAIHILLEYGQDEMKIRVRDNGKGFDKDAVDQSPEGGSGLKRLAKRAKNIGARLQVESTSHVGTTVSIFLPYTQYQNS